MTNPCLTPKVVARLASLNVSGSLCYVYTLPPDQTRPVVCVDETSKQLTRETRTPLPHGPGREARFDYEYERAGVASLFMLFAPLLGWRHVSVRDRRTAKDFAHVLRDLADVYFPNAEKILLVLDNLNTHKVASLYQAFLPAEARRIAERFEWHFTPKNMGPGSIPPNANSAFSAGNASPGASLTRQLWPTRSRHGKQHETASGQNATGNSRPRMPEPNSRGFTRKYETIG